VTALQPLRGVDMVTAVTLVAETGDFRRFASASDFIAVVGLVPPEHSSGGSPGWWGQRISRNLSLVQDL
jgi:transposase